MALLAARHQAIKDLRNRHPFVEEGVLLSKLVGYCSKLVRRKHIMVVYLTLKVLNFCTFIRHGVAGSLTDTVA